MSFSRRQFLAHASMIAPIWTFGPNAIKLWREEEETQWPDSPFLQGNFAPVQEEVTSDNLEVIGELPEGLDGMYVRNGPNPQFAPLGRYHWFDGDGMLHGLRIEGGRAKYLNRYVKNDGWKAEHEQGRAIYGGLSDPPGQFPIPQGAPSGKNTGNTSLVFHHNKLFALMEADLPQEITIPDLETRGEYTFGGGLRHNCTAHPRIDPVTGELFLFGYSPNAPIVRYTIADRNGKIRSTTEVKLKNPVMMHDFAITERYAVFMDWPLTFSVQRARRGEPYTAFERDQGARIGIMDRYKQGDTIRWFEVKPGYVFHSFGAFEDGNEVVLLGCRSDGLPSSLGFGGSNSAWDATGSVFYRWRLSMETGKVQEEALDDRPCEFPRINESLVGRPFEYGFCLGDNNDSIFKYEISTGDALRYRFDPGFYAGEPVFVPHPDADSEDYGWLVTYVFDESKNRSEFVVLDAEDIESGPVARIPLPVRVPFGFHGAWIPGDMI